MEKQNKMNYADDHRFNNIVVTTMSDALNWTFLFSTTVKNRVHTLNLTDLSPTATPSLRSRQPRLTGKWRHWLNGIRHFASALRYDSYMRVYGNTDIFIYTYLDARWWFTTRWYPNSKKLDVVNNSRHRTTYRIFQSIYLNSICLSSLT